MANDSGRKAFRAGAAIVSLSAFAMLAGCASQTPPRSIAIKSTKSKEYFAETEYGVKASPRVTNKRSNLPRGGGRDQIGKPYQVKGQWYYPKEQPGYAKVGKASWYGDAFHGRLTANGEVYDMTHLSAAHPTMPLPSYARVTNLKNGASIMVRVNDRGPYAHGRIIDLSKRAAEMLDYTHSGIAEVKVEYVERAPLEGRDDEYLLASYKPGNAAPDPSDGMPTGVMVAMAGPTPTVGNTGATVAAAAFPGVMTSTGGQPSAALGFEAAATSGMSEFPESGPIIADRPVANAGGAFHPLSYADERVSAAFGAFDVLMGKPAAAEPAYVAVGTFANKAEAQRQASKLSGLGRIDIESTTQDGATWHAVSVHPDGKASLDAILETAWANGATDALVVRD